MISRSELEETGKAIEKALADFAKTHNIEIRYHGGQYGTAEGTIKLKFKKAGAAGVEDTKREWDEACRYSSNIEPWMFGQILSMGGTAYKIIGYRPGRSLKSVRIERTRDGKEFVTTTMSVKVNMPRPTPPAAIPHGAGAGAESGTGGPASILRHRI